MRIRVTVQDLHNLVWGKIRSALSAAYPEHNPEWMPPFVSLEPLISSVGHFYRSGGFPRIVIRRIATLIAPPDLTGFQDRGDPFSHALPDDVAVSEISTLIHEYGHFLRWRDDRRNFDKQLEPAMRASKCDANSMTPLETLNILIEEAACSARGFFFLALQSDIWRWRNRKWLYRIARENVKNWWTYPKYMWSLKMIRWFHV